MKKSKGVEMTGLDNIVANNPALVKKVVNRLLEENLYFAIKPDIHRLLESDKMKKFVSAQCEKVFYDLINDPDVGIKMLNVIDKEMRRIMRNPSDLMEIVTEFIQENMRVENFTVSVKQEKKK